MAEHAVADRKPAAHAVRPAPKTSASGGTNLRLDALERRAEERVRGYGDLLGSRRPSPQPVQTVRAANRTGLPDRLKSGIERLSGLSVDDVRVHYGSPKPARLGAEAYAQGSDIHVAPGQERHLAHEAWHVVQQKQGRVAPTLQMKGLGLNDDAGLEREADAMGALAVSKPLASPPEHAPLTGAASSGVVQLVLAVEVAQNASSLWELFTETTAQMTKPITDFVNRAKSTPNEGPRQVTMMQEAEGLSSKTEAISSQAIGHYKEIELISRIIKQGNLVTLGSDTTKHPDLSVSAGQDRVAVEVKAVSSANDQHIIAVANKARTQLGKRTKDQKGEDYNAWQAQIFIVNPANPWPWTALEANKIAKPKAAEVAERAEEKYLKQNPLPDRWSLSFDSLRWGATVTFPAGVRSV